MAEIGETPETLIPTEKTEQASSGSEISLENSSGSEPKETKEKTASSWGGDVESERQREEEEKRREAIRSKKIDEILERLGLKPAEEDQTKDQFKYLSEKDQRYLLLSGKRLMDKFLVDFPNELPDAIILPETSARPLVYLIDPIMEKISEERGVDKPQIYFFKVDRSLIQYTFSPPDGAFRPDLKAKVQEYTDKMKEPNRSPKSRRKFNEKSQRVLRDWQSAYNDQLKGYNETQVVLKRLGQRASEILGFSRKQQEFKPKIVIFDEMGYYGETTNLIRNAFGEHLPAYALLGNDERSIGSYDIRIGYDVHRRGPGHFDYTKDKTALGVTKDIPTESLYARPLGQDRSQETQEIMRNLRNDMHLIGERIASSL